MQTYPKSTHHSEGGTVSMVRGTDADFLSVSGTNPGFTGEAADGAFLAPLTHENAVLLRRLVPFTAPKPVLSQQRTFGVGDRLGIATPPDICGCLNSTTRSPCSLSSPSAS